MTIQEIAERMGSMTTDAEAQAMIELLRERGFTDLPDDREFCALIPQAIERSKAYAAIDLTSNFKGIHEAKVQAAAEKLHAQVTMDAQAMTSGEDVLKPLMCDILANVDRKEDIRRQIDADIDGLDKSSKETL